MEYRLNHQALVLLQQKRQQRHHIFLPVSQMGLSIVEPFLEDVEDVSTIYIGIAIFAAMMATVVILLLKLDWQRIMGRFAPWTLDENNDNDKD